MVHFNLNLADEHTPTPNGRWIWKAGASALHKFQQATYAAGKTGKAQNRAFSSLKDICKTIKDHSGNTGLSHTETWQPLGTDHAILTVTLHHESGESISSSLPVDITQKNRSGSREQAQGSAMTYARRYLLLGIYGLANDDEDDDGEATTGSTKEVSHPSPKSVPVAQPEQGSAKLTETEKDTCLSILKDPTKGTDIKKQFMEKFYPSAEKLFPNMISHKEHLEFLDALQLNTPF